MLLGPTRLGQFKASSANRPRSSCAFAGLTLKLNGLQLRGASSSYGKGLRHRRTNPVPRATSGGNGVPAFGDWDNAADYDPIGPAYRATMNMLEWHKLCEHVARFASTHAGKRACRALEVYEDPKDALRQTRAMLTLEYDWATPLDFGGIQTSEAEAGLGRAAKGGMMSAQQLRAVVTVVHGAEKLRRQVVVAARENDALRADSPIALLLGAVGRMAQQPHLVRSVMQAIDEDNNIQDGASEKLRMLRGRVKATAARLAGLLKGYGGEVSDKGGRMCVAVPAGTKVPNGVMLGSAPGGGILYIEPSAAVALNNELGAARAEAQAAEETVLWDLTGLVMGALDELQDAYRTIVWLDALAARVRYSLWIDGQLPEVVRWDSVFHARGAVAQRRRAREGEDEEDLDEAAADTDARYAIRLRGLRHPLLYGEYLLQKEALERAVRMSPGGGGGGASSGGGGGGGGRRRMLSNRKEMMLRQAGLGGGGEGGSGSDGSDSGEDDSPQAQLAALRPPRPVDFLIRPDTHVVVITGPNTGGKTAAMKALGLAALMAKAGLALPAEGPARLPAFSAVLADIGDEQSLTANLSTFSGHLKRIQALRAEADGKALLLLDELGTGTDPVEGAALGVALLRRLVKGGLGCGALTIATTHHSVMTGLKFDDPRFENASVEFDEEALAPTYRLLWGIPGRSNALNIAARLGLDPDVVAAARGRLDSSVATVNSAIEQLEELRNRLDMEEEEAAKADREVRTLTRRIVSLEGAVKALQDQLTRARAEALLQVYTLTRERVKEIKLARKKRGKAQPAPPPKPIIAPPSAATAAPTDLQQQPAAAQEEDFWPSEDEIWDAWEAATRSAGPPAAVSASSLAGPAAPGKLPASAPSSSQTPAVPAASLPDNPGAIPAGATAAVSDAGDAAGDTHKATSVVGSGTEDPLRELMVLAGNGDGALGLEELVESLEKKGAARREADLQKPRDEVLYDAALAAVDGIIDAALQRTQQQQQQQQLQLEQELQQQRHEEQQQKGGGGSRKGRRGRGADVQQKADEDDDDLAALMALIEQGEATLNARLQQEPDGAVAQGVVSEGAVSAKQPLQDERGGLDDFADLDALLEQQMWRLADQRQGQAQAQAHGQQGQEQGRGQGHEQRQGQGQRAAMRGEQAGTTGASASVEFTSGAPGCGPGDGDRDSELEALLAEAERAVTAASGNGSGVTGREAKAGGRDGMQQRQGQAGGSASAAGGGEGGVGGAHRQKAQSGQPAGVRLKRKNW